MADIDEDYEGDLGPLLADLAALRSALGDSYRAYGEINPDDDHDDVNWQQQQAATAAATAAPTDTDTVKKALPRKEPAPLKERLAAVNDALAANQSLQQRLQRLITSVNRAQDQAVTLRNNVRAAQRRRQVAASAPHALSAPRTGLDQQFTGVSLYWSQPGADPPPMYQGFNEIKPIVEVLPLVFPRRRWQDEELNALCDGVVQVVQERLLNKILADLEATPLHPPPAAASGGEGGELGGGSGSGSGGDEVVYQAGISLEEFEARQAPIRTLTASSPEVIEIAETLTAEEWATVAHRSVHGRTARECFLAWTNTALPTLHHGKFTAEEDTKLVELVEQYGTRSWERIAAELQTSSAAGAAGGGQPAPAPQPPTNNQTTTTTNTTTANNPTTSIATKKRTPLACMARYQQLLHATRETQEFTDADRERLVHIVNRIGPQWKRVAEEFGGPWDHDQLMHQWRRHAQRHEGADGTGAAAPGPRKGKWIREEDDALLTAVALYGKKWSHVAKLVPGRSDVQCRERYANVLDPDVIKDPWNEQEDEILRENAEKFINSRTGKIKWSAIAALIPGRTDFAVKKRWNALTNAQSRGGRGRGRGRNQEQGGAGGDVGGARGGGGDENVGNGGGGAGPSRIVSVPNREPVAQTNQTNAAAVAAVALALAALAPTAPAPPPPPPPPEPEVPVATRRGRAVVLPARLAE
jgi:hypothetical protein